MPLTLLTLATLTAIPEVFEVLPRAAWLTTTQGAQIWPSAVFREQTDQSVAAFPPDGDVYLHTQITMREADRAGMLYFYSSYALFPRRLRASQEPRVINGGKDLVASAPAPSEDWLRRQRIAAVLFLMIDESGQLKMGWLPTKEL